MARDTATWTRAELKAQLGMDDAQVDAFQAETERVAAETGMPNPISFVGEGDDQLIRVDPVFAKLIFGDKQ